MEINISELRFIVNKILDHVIDKRGISKIAIDKDFYWKVPEESIFEMSGMPRELDVGNLRDDWEFVSALLDSNTMPVACQLNEIAPLLSLIGTIVSTATASEGG